MLKKSILFSIIVIALFNISCRRSERSPSVRTELIDGIQHVYNTVEPVKGEISLDVAEVFRIDSFEIDPEDPPLIQIAVKDDAGNLYLGESRNVKVYKLDSSGLLCHAQVASEFCHPDHDRLGVISDIRWIRCSMNEIFSTTLFFIIDDGKAES